MFTMEDETGSEEPNALDDACGDSAVPTVELAEAAKDGSTTADESGGAYARFMASKLPLQPDDSAQRHCEKHPEREFELRTVGHGVISARDGAAEQERSARAVVRDDQGFVVPGS